MKRQLMISLCATAAMVALAACESDPTFTSQSTAMDWESTKTMIRGDEADTVLIDDQLLEDAVRDMGATGSSNNIKTLISEVRVQKDGMGGKGLSGLGGAFGHAFFDAAEDALKNNGKIDKQERVTTTTFGKIIDYEYAFSPTDWSIGSGRLHVITMVETVKNKRNPNPNPPPPKVTRQAFKWEISVSSGGFEVHDKVAGDQPFPGTMDFSVPMKTRVDLLGFEYKLWAEGNAIEIDNVYHAGNSFDPANWADPGE
jgi:hypothetical protein